MFDLHVHTCYSADGKEKPETIIKYLKKRGFKGMAIVDHSTLKGYFNTKNYSDDFLIIPGMEIKTDRGHILAFGIEEEIKCTDADEVIDEVHDKGGISILAHPFRFSSPKIKTDAIEILNGRSFPYQNEKARKYAFKKNLPYTAGSDGHYIWEMGRMKTFIDANDVDEIIGKILRREVEIDGEMNFWNPVKSQIYSFTSFVGRGFRRV